MDTPKPWGGDPEGSATGYMCLTDWEFEVGIASGGSAIYPSVEDLKRRRPCVENCGIVEVRVSCIRVVEPGKEYDYSEQFGDQAGD